jgi:hypothetical protein
VARVEGEREVHAAAVGDPVARVPEVVLHVAAAHVALGVLVLEAAKMSRGLLHDVEEHVEAAAVGHADDHLLDAELRRRAR